jgi:hypothetical protein
MEASMYSLETYKADKAALDAARQELSCLVANEGTGRCSIWQGEYARIATYFGRKDNISGITSYGDSVRRIARMFMAISTASRITGFDCKIYESMIDQIEKKIKSMRIFKRRPKIKCFEPRSHKQPCFCARLQAVEAAASIANSSVSNDLKEELQAKVNGALILDKEFENEIPSHLDR